MNNICCFKTGAFSLQQSTSLSIGARCKMPSSTAKYFQFLTLGSDFKYIYIQQSRNSAIRFTEFRVLRGVHLSRNGQQVVTDCSLLNVCRLNGRETCGLGQVYDAVVISFGNGF